MAKQPTAKDYEKFGRDMWAIYESNYANRRRAYSFTFFKGVIYGFGIFLGGTILVSLVLWGLTFFKEIPLLTPAIEKIERSLNSGSQIQQP